MTDSRVVRVTVERSDGLTFRIGTDTEWSIPNDGLENFVNLPFEVSTSANVLVDGSSLVGKRVGETDRTISAEYRGHDREGARLKAIAFFNPNFDYKAHVEYMGSKRYIEGEQYAFQCTTGNVYQDPVITWTLLCLDPFFKDEDGNEKDFTSSTPMFGFPFVSHVRETLPKGEKYPVGFMTSVLLFDKKNTVYNNGDMPCFYMAHIEFSGHVVDPVFEKGERFVKVLGTFEDGDIMDIDFVSAPPRVLLNGVNIINRTSRDSNFTGMEMAVGANVFSYTCANEEDRAYMSVSVRFHKKYLGI